MQFVYREREREQAEQRLAFISDLQVAVAAIWSKDGARMAAEHCKELSNAAKG